MKMLKPLSAALLLAASPLAFAEVTLNVPEDIQLLAVNMKSPTLKSGFFSSEDTLKLPDGENQIVFSYEVLFDENRERSSVNSDVYIVKFTAQDSVVNFSLPNYADEVEASLNIDNMEWSLVGEDGKKIEQASEKLKKSGMQLGRNYIEESKEYNLRGGLASVGIVTTVVSMPTITMPNATAPIAVMDQATTTPAAQVAASSTAEEMLYFWYQKADPAAQARFKAYINK